ncbi:Sugar transport protein 1 [Linum grandiflorum]
MAGILFGYDIGISGGVTSMGPFLRKFFPKVYAKQAANKSRNQYCKFDDVGLTMFTSSLYLAALASSLVASWVTKELGRKFSMVVGGFIFFVGAALNAFAVGLWMLILGRLLLGIGVGFSVQAAPLYVSEMAPHNHRGALNVFFQLSITIGILTANVVNYFTPNITSFSGWRLSLGGACIPSLFIFISAIFLPNTPNSILERNPDHNQDQALAMLCKIRGLTPQQAAAEFLDLTAAAKASREVKSPWRNVLLRKYRPQVTMAVVIQAALQLSGINVVMFYAPVLFSSIGFGDDAALLSALVTGAVNVAATLVAIYGVDRWGRRALFIYGGAQMFVFQVLVAGFIGWKFGVTGDVSVLPKWYAVLIVTFICGYVSGFAWSWGPLGVVLSAEIFPLGIRSAAQSIAISTSMLFTFLIAQLFLSMLCHMKFGLFLFFAFFLAATCLFVYLFLPETKNVPIESVHRVWEKHWFWKRFVLKGSAAVDGRFY